MVNFVEVKPEELAVSAFQMIGKDWMLVAAERCQVVNAMTASWGGLGVMWGKNVAYVVIRPQRFTKEFVDASDRFSLTFFSEEYRKMLSYMGTVSGRNENKIDKMGLTVLHEGEVPYFEEASVVMCCKKLYEQEMKEGCFLDCTLMDKWYKENDLHTLYIAEIDKIMIRQTIV